MVDLIFSSVRKLSSSIWSNMADLTEKIDDLICSFDSGGDFTMDTLAMLVFVWLVLGVIVLAVSKYVYGRFFSKVPTSNEPTATKKVTSLSNNSNEPSNSGDSDKLAVKSDGSKTGSAPRSGGKYVPPTPPLRKRLSTKKGSGPSPAGSRRQIHINPPQAAGPDTEIVHWVNELFVWLYSNVDIIDELLSVWLQTLNEYMKKAVTEHGVGLEIVRILPETHPPSISNVFCENVSQHDVVSVVLHAPNCAHFDYPIPNSNLYLPVPES
ncbi:hypothetical protein RUM44_006938 [Polyplax serrata]|uniref:Maintenance of mitochondrial morphology protein 1 n=1 Tax=Polyplax serrata TaxID=468196 RepID=A0ABR1AZA8_POLSC